jgi:hypothetical protein
MEDGEMSDGIRDGLKWMGAWWPVEIAPEGRAAEPDDGRPEVRWMEEQGNGLRGAPLEGGRVDLWPMISGPPHLVALRVASDRQDAGLCVKLNPVEAKQLANEMMAMAEEAEKRTRIEKENVRAEVRAARSRALGPELVEACKALVEAVRTGKGAASMTDWVGVPHDLFKHVSALARSVDSEA